MSKVAVIKVGGSQYLVKEGDTIKTNKIRDKKGTITISEVLFYGTNKTITIEPSKLKKTKVKAKVIEVGRDRKIKVVKFKPKKRELKQAGHRQAYNRIEIEKIAKS